MAELSPRQKALRAKSNEIKDPVKGSVDSSFTLDRRDIGNYFVKYTPLRTSRVLTKVNTVELTDASIVQSHRPEVFEELEFRGYFERKGVKATVLHDPTKVSEEDQLSPQQRAARTRKENEEKAKAQKEAEDKAKAQKEAEDKAKSE